MEKKSKIIYVNSKNNEKLASRQLFIYSAAKEISDTQEEMETFIRSGTRTVHLFHFSCKGEKEKEIKRRNKERETVTGVYSKGGRAKVVFQPPPPQLKMGGKECKEEGKDKKEERNGEKGEIGKHATYFPNFGCFITSFKDFEKKESKQSISFPTAQVPELSKALTIIQLYCKKMRY